MMRKFPKLLAVVLAIAIIICPAMCLTSMAETPVNDYTVSYADDVVTVKVDAANGFLVALLRLDVKGFDVNEAGIAVTTTEGVEFGANPDFDADAGVLSLLLAAKDAANINVVTSATVTIPVTKTAAEGEEYNITLTTIQAADAGSVVGGVLVAEDFIDGFPGVNDAEDGTINADEVGDKALAVNGVQHVCKVVEYVDNGDGTHDGICDCDAQTPVVDNEAHEYDDDADTTCNKCVYEREIVTECQHENMSAWEITQPTKDATGLKTRTCLDCGEHTEKVVIEKPVDITASVTLQHNLKLADKIIDRIAFSVKQISNLGYDAVNNGYFVLVEYEKYGDGYILAPKTKPFLDADKDLETSGTNARSFLFSELALYEMTNKYRTTIYIYDADGVVVAYISNETSIAEVALAYADKYSSNSALLTALADMMNYGKAVQDQFKSGDLVNAASPVEVFAKYMDRASATSLAPTSFPTVANLNKEVATTSFNAKGSAAVGASTVPSYMVMAGFYEPELTEITASYTGAYVDRPVNKVIDVEPTVLGTGKYRYDFRFEDLAIYDLSETVTLTMKYNGVVEATYTYALTDFVTENINNASFTNVLTQMVLFSRSARIALVGSAVY